MIPWSNLPDFNPEWMSKIKSAFDGVGSDKSAHSYERIYQHYLPQSTEPMAILEIGLANYDGEVEKECGSIFGWRRLYPNCMVYGGDWKQDRMAHGENIKTFLVDQGCQESLISFSERLGDRKFDIIVDDASHKFLNSRRTYWMLKHKLVPGGAYIIEDVVRPGVESDWQQTVSDWEEYLGEELNCRIIDARPEVSDDRDSVMVCIYNV